MFLISFAISVFLLLPGSIVTPFFLWFAMMVTQNDALSYVVVYLIAGSLVSLPVTLQIAKRNHKPFAKIALVVLVILVFALMLLFPMIEFNF